VNSLDETQNSGSTEYPRRTVGSYNGHVQPWKAGLSTPFSQA